MIIDNPERAEIKLEQIELKQSEQRRQILRIEERITHEQKALNKTNHDFEALKKRLANLAGSKVSPRAVIEGLHNLQQQLQTQGKKKHEAIVKLNDIRTESAKIRQIFISEQQRADSLMQIIDKSRALQAARTSRRESEEAVEYKLAATMSGSAFEIKSESQIELSDDVESEILFSDYSEAALFSCDKDQILVCEKSVNNSLNTTDDKSGGQESGARHSRDSNPGEPQPFERCPESQNQKSFVSGIMSQIEKINSIQNGSKQSVEIEYRNKEGAAFSVNISLVGPKKVIIDISSQRLRDHYSMWAAKKEIIEDIEKSGLSVARVTIKSFAGRLGHE